MAYKVIQWSTGNVGGFALRAIINHPELELVGLVVHSEAKAGKDAAELCGLDEATGIKATTDWESVPRAFRPDGSGNMRRAQPSKRRERRATSSGQRCGSATPRRTTN